MSYGRKLKFKASQLSNFK